jgi:cyclopropane-fatty-acyl-phospholipid synthase
VFSSLEDWLLRKLYVAVGAPPVRMALHNGPQVGPQSIPPVATLTFRDATTLLSVILNPEVGFGDAYCDGRIQIDDDLLTALDSIYAAKRKKANSAWYGGLYSKWLEIVQRNTPQGSRHNIHRHYDLGNDFYKLWLDRQLLYTCAYFPHPDASLEEAQIAKMDHVCRKVCLRPGERVVEAGCGWGGLALHMARFYGVKVRAFNISHEQILYAQWRARQEGLQNRVEFVEDDYRNIGGRFDVFMSVGMLEHVGTKHYREFGEVIHRSIGDSGRGLLHFIGRNWARPLSAWIRKHIFPGGEPPSLGQTMPLFERWDYSVVDVENIRLHYARTIEHWLERFERSTPQVAAMFDERFVRMWRLYLAGSIAAFRTGSMQLFQLVFAGPECTSMPWTRAHLYEAQEPQGQEWLQARG